MNIANVSLRIARIAASVLVAITPLLPGRVSALSEEQRRVIDSGVLYYNVEETQCGPSGGGGTGELSSNIPSAWRDIILGAAEKYPEVDPRTVAAVLWIENRGWPEVRSDGWAQSSAGARGPFQFIPSTWFGVPGLTTWPDFRDENNYRSNALGTDGDGDGIRDPNNPRDAVEAAFKHHIGSSGLPVAVTGYTAGNAEASFQTTVFQREGNNLLFFLAKYNGSGAPDNTLLRDFPRNENSDYVIMGYWLLATDFDQGYIFNEGLVDAKNRGGLFNNTAPAAANQFNAAAALCPNLLVSQRGQLVGNFAWPVDYKFYQENPQWFTKPHHDYPAADIPVAEGTPIYSMTSGTIISAPTGGACGIGVVIDAGNGVTFTYCHGTDGGSIPGATVGSNVTAGQLIMHSGNTGRSTGPHLHLGISVNGSNRCPQDLFIGMAENRVPSIDNLPVSGCTN